MSSMRYRVQLQVVAAVLLTIAAALGMRALGWLLLRDMDQPSAILMAYASIDVVAAVALSLYLHVRLRTLRLPVLLAWLIPLPLLFRLLFVSMLVFPANEALSVIGWLYPTLITISGMSSFSVVVFACVAQR